MIISRGLVAQCSKSNCIFMLVYESCSSEMKGCTTNLYYLISARGYPQEIHLFMNQSVTRGVTTYEMQPMWV